VLAVLIVALVVAFLILLLVPQKKDQPPYVTGIDWAVGTDRTAIVIRRDDGTLEEVDASVIRKLRPGPATEEFLGPAAGRLIDDGYKENAWRAVR
jgi:hypothetical protein